MNKRINHIKAEILDQYLYADNSLRPWIIGFSGGKDSTILLQLVWSALQEIPSELRRREIYVVCNDTMVENPIITEYVFGVLKKIDIAARDQA
ncbi:MAG: DNA phosphorothioation system sulfurtransferase DndC, partial [Bacteroidetes bacterium]|nr:DNA phosphorothioation system sulfurtransferase DndC [Bacteroidota bacterium]